MTVKLVLVHAAQGGMQRNVMILDVKCAFLYGRMRRTVYIELLRQDPRYGDGGVVGVLRKAMYGTRDAPQIWQEEVRITMEEIGFKPSMLHPSVFSHQSRDLIVVVHIDDFLCSGSTTDLEWLFDAIRKKYDLTRTIVGEQFSEEGHYLNRIIRWPAGGFEMEGYPKHMKILEKEWDMMHCSMVETPLTKEGQDLLDTGEKLDGEMARKVRRGIAQINYMAQDRSDLGVAARVLSQHMANPQEGAVSGIKRVIRYLKRYPRGILEIQGGGDMKVLAVWTDSDWAGDVVSRRSCSGGSLQLGGSTVHHWSKLQANVALSSGEAELNSAVKGISEAIGLKELMQEVLGVSPEITFHVDASACRGILLRQGAGKVKHLTTKQLWVQGAIKAYSIEVKKIPRNVNSADILTHPVSGDELLQGTRMMRMRRESVDVERAASSAKGPLG